MAVVAQEVGLEAAQQQAARRWGGKRRDGCGQHKARRGERGRPVRRRTRAVQMAMVPTTTDRIAAIAKITAKTQRGMAKRIKDRAIPQPGIAKTLKARTEGARRTAREIKPVEQTTNSKVKRRISELTMQARYCEIGMHAMASIRTGRTEAGCSKVRRRTRVRISLLSRQRATTRRRHIRIIRIAVTRIRIILTAGG